MTLPTGTIFVNRYRILGSLGTPGTYASGEAYRVLDTYMNEVVAFKLLTGKIVGPWHEAQQLTALRDDHILPIRNADYAGGVPYLVTALATNGTVGDRISAAPAGSLDMAAAVRWTRQAAVGLTRAHDAGLVHTDVKPDNLFLDAQDNVLLGDFGFASLLDANGEGHLAGSPETIAPEVAAAVAAGRHQGTTVASDVYSLAATTYHMLTGVAVYERDVALGLPGNCARLLTSVPRRLRDLAPHVPRVLYERIERAMSANPLDRPAAASILAAELGNVRLPERRWRRTDEHAGHSGCWRGEKRGNATVLVCAEPAGARYAVRASKSPSGNRIRGADYSGEATPSTLSATVRRVIQNLT